MIGVHFGDMCGEKSLGVWCLYFVWRVDWDVYYEGIFAFHVKEGGPKDRFFGPRKHVL